MPGKRLLHSRLALLLAALALLAALPARSPADTAHLLRELARQDPRFREAAMAYDAHHPERAAREISHLLRIAPDNENLHMVHGMISLEMQRYSQASLAFERALSINPDNQRARLELARAYYHLDQHDQAHDLFLQVLATHPPASVRRNIQAYTERIKRSRPGPRIRARFEVGLLYDDNVNYGPTSHTIDIAPISMGPLWVDQLQLAPESKKKSAWGGFAAASVLGAYRPHTTSTWSLEGYARGQLDKLSGASRYEMGVLQAGIGPRWTHGPHTAVLPVRAEYIARGGDRLATVAGVAPAISRRLTPRVSAELNANADYRRYANMKQRDGFFCALGTHIGLPLGARSRLVTGARVIREMPDAACWRNTGIEAFAGGTYRPHPRLLGYANSSIRHSTYDEREPLAPRDRRDTQWSTSLGLDWRFQNAFGLDMNLLYTRNHSTFDLYDYERMATTWSLYYEF